MTPMTPEKPTHEHIWRNPDLPEDERITALLADMTLEEKIQCCSCNNDLPRLGIRGSAHVEGLHGLTLGGPGKWGRDHATGQDRPQVTTTFPQSYGLAATWDPELLRKVAEQESIECRYLFQDPRFGRGGIIVRAPNADLGRDPRWGRTEECYGEDAFLTGTLAASFVRGLQGDHPRYWRSASLLKHFLANSNEDERSRCSADFDERQWREYYSVPFRMAIEEGGSRAYMAAYNAWNGVPCTVHPMLKDITRDEWGMDGIICTDGGALSLLVSDHRYYRDFAAATAACIKAGINQFLDRYVEGLQMALAEGLIGMADLDAAVRPVFRVLIRLGLLDPPELVPYSSIQGGELPWELPATRALVREVSAASVVLLKNDPPAKGLVELPPKARPAPLDCPLLPVDTSRVRRIALIGKRGADVLLDWYSGTPPYTVSILQGLVANAPAGVDIVYAPSPVDLQQAREVGNPLTGHDGKPVERSVDYAQVAGIAASADLAIVCVGNHPTGDAGWAVCKYPNDGKEAVDRKAITLEEEGLVRAVQRANPNTVAVVVSNFPVAMVWVDQNVPAIVQVANNSQELGNGVADVLFGRVNPSGRLVQTWVRSESDLPPRLDYDLRKGRTYGWFKGTPLYPFGYGLSYSRFDWDPAVADRSSLGEGQSLRISLDVHNRGTLGGHEVVQVYVRRPGSLVERPERQLVAFSKVFVPAMQSKRVELDIPAERLRHWDTDFSRWELEGGRAEFLVARNARQAESRLWVTLGAQGDHSSS